MLPSLKSLLGGVSLLPTRYRGHMATAELYRSEALGTKPMRLDFINNQWLNEE